MQACAGNPFGDEALRIGVHMAPLTADHQGRHIDPGQHVPPVLRAVVEEQRYARGGGCRPDLLADEGQHLGVGLAGEHAAHEVGANRVAFRPGEGRTQVQQPRHVEDGTAVPLFPLGHPGHGGDRRGLVDGDEAPDPPGPVLVDEAPPHRDAHGPAQCVETVETEVADEFEHIAGEPGDAVAVARGAGLPMAAEVDGDETATGRQPLDLMPEHRLRLPPAVQHHQRDARAAGVLVREPYAVRRDQFLHDLSPGQRRYNVPAHAEHHRMGPAARTTARCRNRAADPPRFVEASAWSECVVSVRAQSACSECVLRRPRRRPGRGVPRS